MDITPDQAELFGMHAGDGTLYRTNTGTVWELRGNLNEKEFYHHVVIPLLSKLGIYAIAHKRSGGANGCLGVRSCQDEFHALFRNAGFPVGKKTHTVRIPPPVLMGTRDVRAAFLRGLFATDGSFYLARINGQKNATYPMIELCSASQGLRDDVVGLLSGFDLDAKTWQRTPRSRGGTTYHLRLAGKQKAQTFITHIGLGNPKHQRIADSMHNL